MGLLNETDSAYYSGSNLGGYQFISLQDIVDQFMIAYVGEDKIISKIKKPDVLFHAQRALQEFSFDTLKSIKALEIEVPNTVKMALPQDYVNYSKITRSGSDGIERVLYPTSKTSNPFAIQQEDDGSYKYSGQNLLYQPSPDTWSNYKSNGSADATSDDQEASDWIVDSRGRRYGLDPQHAQRNGTFYVDYGTGYIHFSPSLVGETIVLHYISDGLGTDEEMVVHKFAEEAMYKQIAYAVVSTRSNTPEYIVNRFRKEAFATKRKAKLRLSNIKIEEITQILRGRSKHIKH